MSAVLDFLVRHGGDGAVLVLIATVPLMVFLVVYSALAEPARYTELANLAAGAGAGLLASHPIWLGGGRRSARAAGAPGRRSRHRGHALLHALDLLTLCAAAGLPLDGALVMTDEALRSFDPVLAKLLAAAARVAGEPDATDALEDLAAAQSDGGARRLIAALAVGERAGAPYADTVAKLMAEFRAEEALRLEERAARLPARVALPIIALMVPAALVLTIGPIAVRWVLALLP